MEIPTEESWQHARLIPTSGIKSSTEAEDRASSALLAVLGVVRPFSRALLDPLGASKADRAAVDCFIQVPFKNSDGRQVRPDGLVRVAYGKRSPWTALVEFKTGNDRLRADQINEYWDIARREGFDAVLTVSNEISPAPGVHPVEGLKVRTNSKVDVHHYSWTYILTEAVKQKRHKGIEDPEQAWILGELIRYLEHESSGAMHFDDMGPDWVAVRDACYAGTLNKKDPALTRIAELWDQLIRYSALTLGSEIGVDVQPVITKSHQQNPAKRNQWVVEHLVSEARLIGELRVPNTASDIRITSDLRTRQTTVAAEIRAPDDRRSRSRVTWLIRQIPDAASDIVVEAFAKNARTPIRSTLADIREDPKRILDSSAGDPVRFSLARATPIGMPRKAGRKPGFPDSVVAAVNRFYQTIVQDITPYQPSAPKVGAPPPENPYEPDHLPVPSTNWWLEPRA